MTDRIGVGTMLIRDGTQMPATLVVGTQQYSAGWSSIMGSTSTELGKEIEKAGWTFFYMAGEIRTSGFWLQRSVPGSSSYRAPDEGRNAGALQVFGNYSNNEQALKRLDTKV